jgi:polyhydroxybutyrate depolymerase
MSRRLVTSILSVGLLVASAFSTAAAGAPAAKVQPTASDGCGASKVRPGETRVRTTSGGVPRAYWQHVPPAYNGKKPLPLILDLHGHTEPATVHKNNSRLGPFGDKHGFITITPEGSGPVPRWDTPFDSADMKFLGGLLDELDQKLCVDQRRVFVTGYSNGAFMASTMACLFADRIAAVAPVAGIRAVPGCEPAQPVPVVAFHGVADEWVAFNGGLGPGVYALPPAEQQPLIDSAAPSDSGLSVPGVAAAWAKRNDCGSTPKETSVAADVTLVRYTCPNHADVELYEIEGAGHTWPGSKLSAGLEQFVGKTTFSIDADRIIWKFFQQHPLRQHG